MEVPPHESNPPYANQESISNFNLSSITCKFLLPRSAVVMIRRWGERFIQRTNTSFPYYAIYTQGVHLESWATLCRPRVGFDFNSTTDTTPRSRPIPSIHPLSPMVGRCWTFMPGGPKIQILVQLSIWPWKCIILIGWYSIKSPNMTHSREIFLNSRAA